MASHIDSPTIPTDVQTAFEAIESDEQRALLSIRRMIFTLASETDGVGSIEETLKWGQPSYLTVKPKSGTTIRLGVPKEEIAAGHVAVYVHCGTSVIETFREVYADTYHTEGKRAVYFSLRDPLPENAIKTLLSLALTYHL